VGEARAIDVSQSIGGGYCAKLLGAAGIEVVKAEGPSGDPLRGWSCAGPGSVGDGALFSYLHGGHRSVIIAGEAELRDLIASSEILITDLDSGIDPAGCHRGDPTLIVVSITPYGCSGPYAGRPGSELTVQAESGALAIRGHPRRPPFQAGGQVTEWLAGVYAAVGALGALRGRTRTGRGDLIDVSWAEVANLSCTLFTDLFDSLAGRPDLSRRVARSLETPSVEPTRDGYVGFNTNTHQQFTDFLLLIERPDLLDDDSGWANLGVRMQRWDEWNAIVHAWTTRHTTAEIVKRAAELRIPVAPVVDAPSVLELDHMRARHVFVPDPTGAFVMPRRPWIIDQEGAPAPSPAPRLGEHTGELPHRERSTPQAYEREALPCSGVRIVDLTSWWAGPGASGLLAALGADVIHVESVTHLDGMRMTGGSFADREQWWELSPFFLSINANKRDITLDLSKPEGRDLLLDLVRNADVVMENFTPRVLERFELGWDTIRAVNPKAVMVRMPAFGLDGPWRDRPGFAQTMEQVTGLAWLTGYVDDQPRIQRGPCDPNAGMHAAFATLVALDRRDGTGVGCFVEVPMVEAALAIAAEPVLEWTAYRRLLSRAGNRSPRACPQGVYRCAGAEEWLALSVLNDDHWSALVDALGNPAWARDPALATWAGRRDEEDRIDRALAGWAADQDLPSAVSRLVGHGVPAAAACDPRRASEHPQFASRGFFERVDHPVAGVHPTPTQPFRMASIPRWIRTPAPTIGQHNAEVLAEIGLGPSDIEKLESTRIIGSRPAGL
jgi:crotonobetainyl-CoA:carnitine CoA-transferase CaiB-like acyl-CoA transferase